MKKCTRLIAFALTAASFADAAEKDYSPTLPVRSSPGWFNEWLRESEPELTQWDIGAQVRLRYEVRDNYAIPGALGSLDFRKEGADVDNNYLLHRFKPRVGYSNDWAAFFVEGRSSNSSGDDRNPNPEADGPIDLHQGYFLLGNPKEFPLSLKVGRQELSYGDERLIGAFAWNNIGRVFDAAKLRWHEETFTADLFSGRVIVPDHNNFNMPNDYDWFSGLYITGSKWIPQNSLEAYILSRNTSDESPTVNGTGKSPLLSGPSARDIYTVGTRFRSQPGWFKNWDYTMEWMVQFGHFNDPAVASDRSLEHRAYAFSTLVGYTWAEAAMKPRLSVEYNFGSGDSDPTDGKHETFENLFPTNHKFYGQMDFLSLQNMHNFRVNFSLRPTPRFNLLFDYHAFWLASTDDNFYTVGGTRRGGLAATPGTGYGINDYGSYVGSEIDLIATYSISPYAQVEGGIGHFFRGDYVKSSLSAPGFGSEDANFAYLQLNLNF